MLNYSKVIKSSKAYKTIDLDISGSRLSHAYLFMSADDNYLKAFSELVCKRFITMSESEEKIEAIENRIEKCVHPDVKIFGEDKNIDVKITEEILEEVTFSPFEADKKIYVLANVQNMNDASQNKILKTIEEPPKNTFFILTCNSTSKLLQTILSRVKKIELDKLTEKDIQSMLKEKGVDDDKSEILASCSNGNGKFAEKLALDDGFISFYNDIVSMLFEINGSRDVLKYSNLFSAKNVDKNEFFDIVIVILRDVMMLNVGKEQMISSKSIITKLKMVASMLNITSITELISKCLECKKKLAFNVNSTAVIDEFLFKLAEVKVKCRRLQA